MKKINFLTLLFTALLVSGNVWGGYYAPNPETPSDPQHAGVLSTNMSTGWVKPDLKKPIKKTTIKKATHDTGVVECKGVAYESLAAALASSDVQDGDVIKLLNNINEVVVISKSITIDLDGWIIYNYYAPTVVEISNNANVTILNTNSEYTGYIMTYSWTYLDGNDQPLDDGSTIAIKVNSGSLTLRDNVVVTGNAYCPYYGIQVASGATLNMDGAKCYAYSRGVYSSYGTVNVSGDSYLWSECYALYGGGDYDISGNADIWSGYYGLYVFYGNLHVSGKPSIGGGYMGIYAYGETTIIDDAERIYSDGELMSNGYAYPPIYIYDGTATINGGYIDAPKSPNATPGLTNVGTLYVYGGFFSVAEDCPGVYSTTGSRIYGGTFTNKEVPLTVNQYYNPTDDYDYFDNGDGTYTVMRKIAKNLSDNKVFLRIKDAVAAASVGDEIILLADKTDTVTFDKTITFNTYGKKLSGDILVSGDAVLSIIGEGTITGTLSTSGNGKINVYEGYFEKDPTEFVAKESTVSFQEEKYYVHRAKLDVNGVEYETFAQAVAAAELLDNPTIKLLADAKFGGFDYQNISKSMTIDLNSHKLYAESSQASYLRIGKASTIVTFQNGTITNSPTATSYPNYLIFQEAANTIRLDNVTISNKGVVAVAIGKDGATCEVSENCNISGTEYGVRIFANATLVNNGTITVGVQGSDVSLVNNTNATMKLVSEGVYGNKLSINNLGTFIIIGGVYNNSCQFSLTSEPTSNPSPLRMSTNDVVDTRIILAGGKFYPDLMSSIVADMKTDDSSFKIEGDKEWNKIKNKGVDVYDLHSSNETEVATIGSGKYYDLNDAIAAVATDNVQETIVLQDSIELELSKGVQYAISKSQNIKLDLNGYTIRATNESSLSFVVLFQVNSGATLTIEDNSPNKDGKITYLNNFSGAVAYTIYCSGNLIVNSGNIEHTSAKGVVFYAIQLENEGDLTINGGTIYGKNNYAIRYWPGASTSTSLILNDGEIKGASGICIQVTGDKQWGILTINGGKLTAPIDGQALYIESDRLSFENIYFNITNGEIIGKMQIHCGDGEVGNINERIGISGGTFYSSNAFLSYERGFDYRCVSGGAFYFDMNDPKKVSNKDFIKFCEYIETGHYALKMCRDDENGTYTNDKIEGKYTKCEGEDCGDGTFWAVIDGEGTVDEKKPDVSGTWTDGDKGGAFDGKVPDEKTDVTISAGTKITILSDTVAKANRLILEDGAGITIKYDATLEVGLGGIEVNGDGTGTTYIIVEPGGTLKANGTVVSSSVKEIIVEANADTMGVVLFDPSIDYNNQPKSTVQMYTYARYIPAESKYIWQHFGIPTKEAPESITNNRSCRTQYWQWNYEQENWEQVNYATDKAVKTPFRGYNIKTDYQGTDGVIYTFTGNILGNKDQSFDLKPGFNFYGNSYLAPIDATTLIGEMDDDNVEWTVWLYDGQIDNFIIMNAASALFDEPTEIPSLRGFFLRLKEGDGGSSKINYESAVWGNAISKKAAAPARQYEKSDMNTFKISITADDGKMDKMYFIESSRFDAGFDNGFDATKFPSKEGFNLYAETLNGNLAGIATNDIDGQYLSLDTKDQSNYTMQITHQNGDVYTLVDLENNNEVRMEEGATYTFTAQPNSTLKNRFQVRKIATVTTGVDNTKSNLSNNDIYTVLGQYVGKANMWSILPSGVYVINGEKVVK